MPADPSDVDAEGKTIAFDAPRSEFADWILVDIPAAVSEIAEGADSDGITPRGKPTGATELGVRGANDYTALLGGDPDLGGSYGGCDGPFPPWNDERIHRYRFVVDALDVANLELADGFSLADVRETIDGHILAQAEWHGSYSLNPTARHP